MPNPLLQPNYNQIRDVYNAMRTGNPMQVLQQVAQRSPQFNQVMQMMNKGVNPKQLFYQMCSQRGINPDEFIKNLNL